MCVPVSEFGSVQYVFPLLRQVNVHRVVHVTTVAIGMAAVSAVLNIIG
jgi:hypothetical protein